MKHIKQFKNKKEVKNKYTECLTSVFNTTVSINVNNDKTVDIKIHKFIYDENDIKNIFRVFGSDVKFFIKQKQYSQQVIILIDSIPTTVIDTIVDQNKYNL